MKRVITIFAAFIVAVSAMARTITVDDDGPADFNDIQAAIDDAYSGDEIVVADGTYTGPGNRNIRFLGKSITVRSQSGPENCIIDGQDSYVLFRFIEHELPGAVLDGLTITNAGNSGIFCSKNSSPTIANKVKCIKNAETDCAQLVVAEDSPKSVNAGLGQIALSLLVSPSLLTQIPSCKKLWLSHASENTKKQTDSKNAR